MLYYKCIPFKDSQMTHSTLKPKVISLREIIGLPTIQPYFSIEIDSFKLEAIIVMAECCLKIFFVNLF